MTGGSPSLARSRLTVLFTAVVNGSAASDYWGTKNAGINYGMLFTAWGVAGIIGPRIGGVFYDKYHNYEAAFYTAAGLAAAALGLPAVPVPEFYPTVGGGNA